MMYLLQILIYFHIICQVSGVFEWTVIEKATDYGQNVTLFCNVPKCCPELSGWERWTPVQRTLFIDVKTGRPNKKYDGKVYKDGYTLVIQDLNTNDINVSYSCLYGITFGEQKILRKEDAFEKINTAEPYIPPTNSRLSEVTLIGIVVGILLLIIIAIVIVFLYKKKKLEKIKAMCHGNRRNVEDQVVVNHEGELQPLNRNVNFNDLDPEQQDNINNIRHMHVIERNISHVSVTDKPENNNLTRVDSECPSGRFDSDSNVFINRQLSNITTTDRIDSTTSENSLLIQERLNSNSQCVNRANSVPDIPVFPRGELIVNGQVLNRAESVPQQVSCEEDGDMCINIGNSPVHSPTSQLLPSPTRYPYLENGGGACIPLPDFDNIQSSSPVMNTELPNIAEFKRSLSKDCKRRYLENFCIPLPDCDDIQSFSSVMNTELPNIAEFKRSISKDSESSSDFGSTSSFRSAPEEIGKEIQEEVTDIPQASDITNQIDSRLEQYNHTVTGVDEDFVCSIQRLPSEREEETTKKNDLDSNLDSGMASKLGDYDLASRSDCSYQ